MIGWSAVLFVYGLDAGPLYRTESLRAIVGRECLHGHWLFPVLYGEPFLTKPPGHYAAIGLCSYPLGEVTAATARLPSVLAATAVLFLMYSLFRRAVDERAALAAALLLPTSILWLDKVPSAEIDMTLVGWVTASLVFAYRAVESGTLVWWVLAFACVAGGTLTKWTAPAFFGLTVGSLLLWRGEVWKLYRWRPLLALAIAIGACGLWAGSVVEQVGWQTLVETVRHEAAYRFSPKSTTKGYPWADVATYPAIVFAAHLPLALFALFTFRPSFWAKWDGRGRLLLQFLHCWVWPNMLFWAIVPNHNVRYALPIGPGLMGLGVMGCIGWWKQPHTPTTPRLHWTPMLALCLAVWLAAKVVFVEFVIPARTTKHNPKPAATELRARVPDGVPLYLFRLKDEGILFYYGRPAIRLHDPRDLPAGAYAVLIGPEWEDRTSFGHLNLVYWMHDQQGDPLILVQCPIPHSPQTKPKAEPKASP